jgi:hypothetical protein
MPKKEDGIRIEKYKRICLLSLALKFSLKKELTMQQLLHIRLCDLLNQPSYWGGKS